MASGLFKFFASLKLAVFCLLSLAAVLATATSLESLYGMRAAHVMVYGTWWFGGLLFLLGTNVLCAALSRYPWKKHQTGFVITHSGILIILFGSLATKQFGVDGNLPIFENSEDNDVILNDLVLALYDENGSLLDQFPVPESGVAREGRLMEVHLAKRTALVLDQFLPRARPEQVVEPTPMPGVGAPALKVELFNSRFHLEQWLLNRGPKATEVSLGPAVLSLQKLWSQEEWQRFAAPRESEPRSGSPKKGLLIVNYQGREFRIRLEEASAGWTPLGSSSLQVRVERYLPYAIVQNNQLVSKSNEPVNPAVQLTVRDVEGNAEQHTIFAKFPEFNTLQRSHHKVAGSPMGLKFRLLASQGEGQTLSIVGNRRGRLQFALSPDNSKIFYRVAGISGANGRSGEVVPGKEEPTGWMDLKFKVVQWYPAAVQEEKPHYIEFIQGSDNFQTAVHLHLEDSRKPSSHEEGMWLMEGSSQNVTIGGRQMAVQYTKRRLLLPFFLRLEKFTIGTDPGTSKAASYSSQVVVKDRLHGRDRSATISMNEPLQYGGYTFYQASYQMEEGQPPLSVFSVNYDPGRMIKYLGSIVMILGILIMFYMNPHYLGKMLARRKDSV